MNCYNHPDRSALAICTSCGGGICNECMSPKTGLCVKCYKKYLRGKMVKAIKYLVLLAGVGVIGYLWDPMGKEGMSQPGISSYMLMATLTGIILLTGKLQIPTITFIGLRATDVGIMMLLIMIIKFIIAVVLGVILLPIIITWQVATIVINILRLRKSS